MLYWNIFVFVQTFNLLFMVTCLNFYFYFLSFQRLARLPKGPTLHFRVLKVNRANWNECFEQWRRWWQLKSWLFGDVFKVNALMCPNCRHVIRTFSLFFFLIKSLFLVFLFSTPWLKMWFHLWKSTGCTSSSSPTTRCLY